MAKRKKAKKIKKVVKVPKKIGPANYTNIKPTNYDKVDYGG